MYNEIMAIGVPGKLRALPAWAGRFPLTAIVLMQALVVCLPNGWLQASTLGLGPGRVLLVQSLNLAILAALPLLFRRPAAAVWLMTPLAALALYSTDFYYHFGGMPSVGAYLSLLQSNLQEILDYLVLKWEFSLAVLAFSLAYGVLFLALARRIAPEFLARRRKGLLCACLCLIALIANWDTFPLDWNHTRPAGNEVPLKNSFPVGFFISAQHAYAFLHGRPAPSRDFHFHAWRPAAVAGPETYVLAIGESASAAYWSLSGYDGYDTNARMRGFQASGHMLYFPRTVAQANLTYLSVPMLITSATPSQPERARTEKSLLAAFKEAGFTTYWLSNQDAAAHMEEADFPLLLHRDTLSLVTNYDEDLLPLLDSVLAAPAEKKLIVLHLMGSHSLYRDRVPKAFATPGLTGASLTADYVRSICYTDSVLDSVLGRLGRRPGRSFLWYVSDHGEELRRGEVGHGSLKGSLDQYHVPMLFWANDRFLADAPGPVQALRDRRGGLLSQGVTFPTFLGLAGVTYPGLDGTRDLAGPRFLAGPAPRVLRSDGGTEVLSLAPK